MAPAVSDLAASYAQIGRTGREFASWYRHPWARPYHMRTSFFGWTATRKVAGVESLSEDKESTDFGHFQATAPLLTTRESGSGISLLKARRNPDPSGISPDRNMVREHRRASLSYRR
jgi:hypothetical protein